MLHRMGTLGVTLFALLSEAVPFGKGDVTYHHRHTSAPDVRELAAHVPAPMAEVIAKLLEKDLAARVQNAAEMDRVFQDWLES